MHKLQEDKLWVGIVVGVFFTLTMFYFFYTVNNDLIGKIYFRGRPFQGVSERFVSILSVVFDIIPFFIYIIAKKDNAMRGVGMLTVILALFIMVYYFLLNNPTLL